MLVDNTQRLSCFQKLARKLCRFVFKTFYYRLSKSNINAYRCALRRRIAALRCVRNVIRAGGIKIVECAEGVINIHHRRGAWIHNSAVQTVFKRTGKESGVYFLPFGKPEGDI